MEQLSETGLGEERQAYRCRPTAQLVQPFKNLSMRLNVGEVGVVKSEFGIHIIQRVE